MNDEVTDLIRELAAEHGVALDRSDPILVLQTATRRIVRGVFEQAQAAQADALAQHRSELELAAVKWQADSKLAASSLIKEVQTAVPPSVAAEVGRASRAAAEQLSSALERHEKAIARATTTCALAAAVAVLAAGAFIGSAHGAFGRADGEQRATCSGPAQTAVRD